MNFLCNINQSYADLLINYHISEINKRKKKGVLRNFGKFLRTPFFKE